MEMGRSIFIHCPICKRTTLHCRALLARSFVCTFCGRHEYTPQSKPWRQEQADRWEGCSVAAYQRRGKGPGAEGQMGLQPARTG